MDLLASSSRSLTYAGRNLDYQRYERIIKNFGGYTRIKVNSKFATPRLEGLLIGKGYSGLSRI